MRRSNASEKGKGRKECEMWRPYGRLELAHVLSRTSGGAGDLLVQKTVHESRVEVATLRQLKAGSCGQEKKKKKMEIAQKEREVDFECVSVPH